MIIACAADCKKGFFWDLEKKVLEEGIEFLWERISPFSWAAMIEWERDVCARFPSRQIVFVDAWDFLMLGTQSELKWALDSQDVLFHSDAHCWPEPHKADFYPPSPSKFRYVNGTGPAGYGQAIGDLIDWGLTMCPIRGRESSIFADNDQRFWTDVYLYHDTDLRTRIDTHCALTLPLNCTDREDFNVIGKRVYTYPGGIPPVFVHANGYSEVIYEAELEKLRRSL